jgi:hypothetical protein
MRRDPRTGKRLGVNGNGLWAVIARRIGVLLTAVGAFAADGVFPWEVNSPIVEVKKELYAAHPREGAAAIVGVRYVGPGLERVEVQGVEFRNDVLSERVRRISMDNGRTWSDFEPLETPETTVRYAGVEVWEGPGCDFYDGRTSLLVGAWLRQIAADGRFSNATYIRTSRDFGKTWSDPEQLKYEIGPDFDVKRPLDEGFRNRNQAYFGSNFVQLRDGTLVHCVALANASGDPENDTRAWRMGSLCFRGTWDNERGIYRWVAGERIEISSEKSSRGLMEPELAEIGEDRLLVIWRGSNTETTAGRKWFNLSNDGGVTWGAVQELKYDDGTRFYSPSSYHRMLRHTVTGKLYWFGNISRVEPKGNWPRFPLIVAEVDERLPALKKATVSVIDDRLEGQPDQIQFSNFSLLENRETHDVELYLTAYGESDVSVFNADCYKYALRLK